MTHGNASVTRRHALKAVTGLAAGLALGQRPFRAEADAFWRTPFGSGPITKLIPSSGEQLPVIGIDASQPAWEDARWPAREFLSGLARVGAKLINDGPTPFREGGEQAETNIGTAAVALGARDKLLIATCFSEQTFRASTQRLGGIDIGLDAAGGNDLPRLRELKQAKQIRYVGTGGYRLLEKEKIDFLFCAGYSILDREYEKDLLPRAKDNGVAFVAINPFWGGRVFQKAGRHPLPDWAAELGITSWAQFALKYVISHPAVVSATPSTLKLEHLRDNLGAARGPLPDEATRRKMAVYFDSLP